MNPYLFQLIFYFLRLFSRAKVSAALPLAQAVHESANWTSPLYRRSNNMFGMTPPNKRDHVGTGITGGFLAYATALDSIRDYFYWPKVSRLRAQQLPLLIGPSVVTVPVAALGIVAAAAVINQTKHA